MESVSCIRVGGDGGGVSVMHKSGRDGGGVSAMHKSGRGWRWSQCHA